MSYKDKEKKREYDKLWYQNHKEERKKTNHESYLKNKEKRKKQYLQYRELHKYEYYKINADKRNISFSLTEKEFNKIVGQPCYYCRSDEKIGIDRIDNYKGYTLENCVPCCSMCNYMKRNYTVSEFIEKCTKIAEKHKKQN